MVDYTLVLDQKKSTEEVKDVFVKAVQNNSLSEYNISQQSVVVEGGLISP